MENFDEECLNVDISVDDIEERMEVLQKMIVQKLTEKYGYELRDNTLPQWIIKLSLINNLPKSKIEIALFEYIENNNVNFIDWLWTEVPKI